MTSDQIIRILDLKPYLNGGFFRETHRSELHSLGTMNLIATSVYYLLTPAAVSKFYKFSVDMSFHFYCGDPITWIFLKESGEVEKFVMGSLLEHHQVPQLHVAASTWVGGFVNPGGSFSLLGIILSPGMDFQNITVADREQLMTQYAIAEKYINQLS
jgi:predicted cupin superfamily sugar epimerase